MTKLTTHVLDVYSGKPGKGIKVDLYYYKNDDQKSKINTIVLNNDGRTDKALIEGIDFKEGKYELIFFIIIFIIIKIDFDSFAWFSRINI